MDDTQLSEEKDQQIPKNARKPKLSIEEQIGHLESKGVSFELCDKEQAAAYLSEKNYFFKLASYRKLFEKHVGGENDGRYVSLDFGHLTTLASVDQQLREVLLPMTLDIEHFVKVDLLRRATENCKEDGYALVHDYCDSLSARNRTYLESELKSRLHDEYCGAIIEKYRDDMPLWAFVEVISFGTLVDLVRFCSIRWEDEQLEDTHYLLKYVKGLRNATAHSSCILNAPMLDGGHLPAPPKALRKAVSQTGLSKAAKRKIVGNLRMRQISTTSLIYKTLVPAGESKSRCSRRLSEAAAFSIEAEKKLPENNPAVSAMALMRKLISEFGLV